MGDVRVTEGGKALAAKSGHADVVVVVVAVEQPLIRRQVVVRTASAGAIGHGHSERAGELRELRDVGSVGANLLEFFVLQVPEKLIPYESPADISAIVVAAERRLRRI